MSGQGVLPENIMDIISAAVSQAVQQTKNAIEAAQPPAPPSKATDYYRVMEKLLYNYPKLKRLVADKDGYTSVVLTERSKSVVKFSPNRTYKDKEDIIDEIRAGKESQYERILSDFRRLDEIIGMFADRKEFIVIRMYYFNEDIDGNERGTDAERNTFLDISLDLERDEKTVRRWKTNIVKDMAICLFGFEAALEGE